MAITLTTLETYASSRDWWQIPGSLQALGEITGPDGRRLLSIAFAAERDIITSIGYAADETCPPAFAACAAILCGLAHHKAVMAAQLLGPSDIASAISDGQSFEDDAYYAAVIATLALKNALSSYASHRAVELKAWKAGQPD
ncbi:hypothetical protein [Enterocloster lavalensis]|uniref:hypothetical protein n=1 Tax=Enterocloster lavalensis TaxID=460384 RepID=UPI0023F1C481|nr:hypothetical protein [Enterocloster lavalensis]